MKSIINIIEKSQVKITKPNDCYNSGIVDAKYKLNGPYEFETIQVSICYGKPKLFVLWKGGKIFREISVASTTKGEFKSKVFSNKFITIDFTGN